MSNKPSLQSYYLSVDRMVSDRLKRETPEYLARIDFEEFLTHLIEEHAWAELEWDESALTMEPFVGRHQVNDFGRTLEVERPRVRLRVPFRPHSQRSELLELMPSSMRLTGEPQWRFEGNTLLLEADAGEEAIERALEEMRYWLGGRNSDIRNGNATLRQIIEPIWRRKREELERHYGTLKALIEKVKIPLHQDAHAPKPVVLIKPKTIVTKPSLKPVAAEPELDRNDVLGIVSFIEAYSRQLEVTPGVYSKLEEEELRDLVLSLLNVNIQAHLERRSASRARLTCF